MRLACLFLFLPIIGSAQPKASGQDAPAAIKPLTIGDTVPDVVLENIINYPTPTARLSDFKGKLLILDFFATWCTVCIKKMPEINTLQEKYADRLQVLVITADTREQIARIFRRSAALSGVRLPFVTSDSSTGKLFPHIFIPHYAWIGGNGKVVAITGPDEVTEENLRKAFAGEALNLPVKKDVMDFRHKIPLLQDGNGGSAENILARALLTNYLPGVPASRGFTVEGTRKRYYFTNHTLLSLFRYAFGFAPNQVRINTKDSTRFYPDKANAGTWNENNLFSYEIFVPSSWSKEKVNDWMIDDLCRYFSISARWEKVRAPCYILLDSISRHKVSGGGKPQIRIIQGTDSIAFINQPIEKLIDAYNNAGDITQKKPFIFTDSCDSIKIDCVATTQQIEDFEQFKLLLQSKGFTLYATEKELNFFIVKDVY